MLKSTARFMFDNIGNITSTKKIADTMTSAGRKISVHTVENYLDALTESFIFYKIGRYDVKGRQHLKTGDKYYAADVGLRYAVLGAKMADAGHILENVVCLELLRRGYEVYVGKVGAAEVDLVLPGSLYSRGRRRENAGTRARAARLNQRPQSEIPPDDGLRPRRLAQRNQADICA